MIFISLHIDFSLCKLLNFLIYFHTNSILSFFTYVIVTSNPLQINAQNRISRISSGQWCKLWLQFIHHLTSPYIKLFITQQSSYFQLYYIMIPMSCWLIWLQHYPWDCIWYPTSGWLLKDYQPDIRKHKITIKHPLILIELTLRVGIKHLLFKQ